MSITIGHFAMVGIRTIAQTQPKLHPDLLRKDDRRTVYFGIKKPQRPTSCARDTVQGEIFLKNANER
jgi:hypothetical protein